MKKNETLTKRGRDGGRSSAKNLLTCAASADDDWEKVYPIYRSRRAESFARSTDKCEQCFAPSACCRGTPQSTASSLSLPLPLEARCFRMKKSHNASRKYTLFFSSLYIDERLSRAYLRAERQQQQTTSILSLVYLYATVARASLIWCLKPPHLHPRPPCACTLPMQAQSSESWSCGEWVHVPMLLLALYNQNRWKNGGARREESIAARLGMQIRRKKWSSVSPDIFIFILQNYAPVSVTASVPFRPSCYSQRWTRARGKVASILTLLSTIAFHPPFVLT